MDHEYDDLEWPAGAEPGPPQSKTPGISIASLVLGLLSLVLFCLAGIPAIILGILGLTKWSKDPYNIRGQGFAIAGIVLGGLGTLATPLFLIIAAVLIPNFISLQDRAYDASANSAGRNAKLAEEVYFNQVIGVEPSYTNKLTDLLAIDPQLTSDPGVMFSFGDCNREGYTFTTWHRKGSDRMYVYTD